ncbi:MAG: bifunctional riboflavin kinase/FAD synthetase [Arenimonas sp.]
MTILFRDVSGQRVCSPQGSVVCIGAFDGLHRGHQALIEHTRLRARESNLPLVALSFEPLPREFFSKDAPPPRLLLPRAKYEGLAALGCDVVGLLRFDAKLSTMSAEDFIEQVLVRKLNANEVWVGPEFRFGKGRRGDIAMLQTMGAQLGFTAHEITPVLFEGERVSSTRLRLQLASGDMVGAEKALGRRYAIAGKVVYGKQLGRKLGYPTANIRLAGKHTALHGIYATWVHGVGPEKIASVSSLGTRPTVFGVEPLLEAHLFDFDGDLYGKRIEVEFVAKLRDEEKFDDLAALVRQMDMDSQQARKILRHDKNDKKDIGVNA